MTVSLILEVAISMVFLYLLGSQVVLSIYELWAGYTNSRGKFLYRRLKGTLGIVTTQKLYAQAPIAALTPAGQVPPTSETENFPGFWFGMDGLPAYIPANLFASGLLTLVAPTATNQPGLTTALTTPPAGIDQEAIDLLKNILAGLDANASLEDCQKSVAAWYDAYGERLTGWYKRQVRAWLFLIGLVVAFVGNIDSPFILRYLWAHPQLSRSIADAGTQATQSTNGEKLREADKKAKALNPSTAAGTTDNTAAQTARPVSKADSLKQQSNRLTAKNDSLLQVLKASEAQIQALSDHLHGLGFPIGRADSASRDSARLPDVFYVLHPARTVRQGRKLIDVPDYYLQYTRTKKTTETTTVPGITSQSFEWTKKALPTNSVSKKAIEGRADRSEGKPWYEPVFGPQSQSKWHTILGWLLTALALSVGAPFWFDLLCRLVNIRNLGIKPPRPEG